MKKIVFITGAGISAASGLQTFRGSDDSLWNNHRVEDVCTASALLNNPTLVNDFYNMRRIEILNAEPNEAHLEIADNECNFDIHIITTNIDNMHERAGSTKILHLHGEILKARSSNSSYDWMGMSHDEKINNPKLYDVGRKGLNYYKDYAEDGFPLRPHVVLFDESVPLINDAAAIVRSADILCIIGSSLSVYPAASLYALKSDECELYYIDPSNDNIINGCTHIREDAVDGIFTFFDSIMM